MGNASGSVPALRGQNYTYLDIAFSRIAHGERPDIDKAHVALAAKLDEQGGKAIADYLSRLPPPAKHRGASP